MHIPFSLLSLPLFIPFSSPFLPFSLLISSHLKEKVPKLNKDGTLKKPKAKQEKKSREKKEKAPSTKKTKAKKAFASLLVSFSLFRFSHFPFSSSFPVPISSSPLLPSFDPLSHPGKVCVQHLRLRDQQCRWWERQRREIFSEGRLRTGKEFVMKDLLGKRSARSARATSKD